MTFSNFVKGILQRHSPITRLKGIKCFTYGQPVFRLCFQGLQCGQQNLIFGCELARCELLLDEIADSWPKICIESFLCPPVSQDDNVPVKNSQKTFVHFHGRHLI